MKLLAIASNYPYAGYPFAGVFNEKCVVALKNLCDHIEVVVPSPYIPPFLAFNSKLKIFSQSSGFEIRKAVAIHRLPFLWLPKFGATFWADKSAYLCIRKRIKDLHRVNKFDAIISFNLYGGGNIAWRIGRDLGIPATGWAFGSEVRFSNTSAVGKVVSQTIKNLDLVFYQSTELLETAAKLINKTPEQLSLKKHIVLPHGIPIPSLSFKRQWRKNTRKNWDLKDDEIAVVYIGRITKAKGISELLQAISTAASSNRKIYCILVGSMPALDESTLFLQKVENDPILKSHVKLFPGCEPDKIWEILCGADIFVLPSHHEGMPNSLLEAMAVAVPGIAFDIQAVNELDNSTCSLIKVPSFNNKLLAEAILELAQNPEQRKLIGAKGRKHVIRNFKVEKQMARAVAEIGRVGDWVNGVMD